MKKTIAIFLTGIISINLSAQSGEDNFKTVCAACHTIGKGMLVGPDLKGTHKKHPEKWMLKWIKSSQTMVNEGDKKAVELFNQYNQIPMPDNPQFSDADVKAILAYIKKESGDTEGSSDAAAPADSKQNGNKEEAGKTPETAAGNHPPASAGTTQPTPSADPAGTSTTVSEAKTIPAATTGTGNTFLSLLMGIAALFFLAVLGILARSVSILSKELKGKYTTHS